jgi:prepilin-type N-terminal cleavage/methylation domain-containing protein
VLKLTKFLRSERGYTFIELLVAITMLGIIIVPVAALFTTGYAGMVRAGRRTAASNLCREKIEEVKANGYSYYIQSISGSQDGIFVDIEESPGGSNLFRRETRLQRVKVLSDPDLEGSVIRITVKVTWKEFETERTVQMESYLSNRVMPE